MGVGLGNDGKVIWDALNAEIRNFVDIGLMAKISKPEEYVDEDLVPLSLERTVHDFLGKKIDKTLQKNTRWDLPLNARHIECAYVV